MRFPGRRKHKHYFPVNARDPLVAPKSPDEAKSKTHVVGVDQTLVDIDARVPESLLTRYELAKGASTVIPDERALRLYDELLESKLISYEFAGGRSATRSTTTRCWPTTRRSSSG